MVHKICKYNDASIIQTGHMLEVSFERYKTKRKKFVCKNGANMRNKQLKW